MIELQTDDRANVVIFLTHVSSFEKLSHELTHIILSNGVEYDAYINYSELKKIFIDFYNVDENVEIDKNGFVTESDQYLSETFTDEERESK